MPNSWKFSTATYGRSGASSSAPASERPLNVPTSRYASPAGSRRVARLSTASSAGVEKPGTAAGDLGEARVGRCPVGQRPVEQAVEPGGEGGGVHGRDPSARARRARARLGRRPRPRTGSLRPPPPGRPEREPAAAGEHDRGQADRSGLQLPAQVDLAADRTGEPAGRLGQRGAAVERRSLAGRPLQRGHQQVHAGEHGERREQQADAGADRLSAGAGARQVHVHRRRMSASGPGGHAAPRRGTNQGWS